MELQAYQWWMNDYRHLGLKDLLDAQDFYHIHLMGHPNVVATALGRYRIRHEDSWPDEQGPGKKHGTGERTLENSEVRPYSWPAILVFVEEWAAATHFGDTGKYDPDQMIPKTLYLPDGRRVPVCVIKAPRQPESPPPVPVRFPLNNIGGGRPILARVQGQEHVATIACLVRDGHKIYALTNRHVTGETGEILYTQRQGRIERIGVTAAKQLTRIPFMELYHGFIGKNAYVSLDIGLIDIDDINDWTAQIEGIGMMGPMADLSVQNLSLALIGCNVRGHGSASGLMLGEIQALFYRYKSRGGFDYIADFFIGPRSASTSGKGAKDRKSPKRDGDANRFATHPGDSGTLFLLEPQPSRERKREEPYLPLAVQWGAQVLGSDDTGPQSYALATCLSTVCELLDVDPVRDWNLDQPETWGAVGHFSIGSSVAGALSGKNAKLKTLMTNNALLIAPDDSTIRSDDFKGMGSRDFVPLADVPDFFWKPLISHQGHARPFEGPNHFADMDHKNSAGDDLLSLCQDPKNIDPQVWNSFYDSIVDLENGKPIEPKHRGLLPFRVWQIFDEMVRFASEGKAAEFVCAAGVLTHYVGDACQPLHISYLHDGDPLRPDDRNKPLGTGVHSIYEDNMVNAHRGEILTGLADTSHVAAGELIGDGFTAAGKMIELMRNTFQLLPPSAIVETFVGAGGSHDQRAEQLWDNFGAKTIQAMQSGTHLLAVLWESAWAKGGGEAAVGSTKTLSEDEAMSICSDRTFLESLTVKDIAAKLKRPDL